MQFAGLVFLLTTPYAVLDTQTFLDGALLDVRDVLAAYRRLSAEFAVGADGNLIARK